MHMFRTPSISSFFKRPAKLCSNRRSNSPSESRDRKSTRLNSSHGHISYAVFCLKKKHPSPVANRPETVTRPAESTARIRSLVERAQEGEREALEELYLLNFDRIYSYLHMSVGNRPDAEDLTTQTFLKMLQAIGRFRCR